VDAFAEAKKHYVQQLRTGSIEKPTATDRRYARVLSVTGTDPLPYGIDANRGPIEELLDHAIRQRILDRRPDVDSLFARGTRELTA
ncbi:MAG: hypothetical protein ACRDRL_20475, partial [Sciscionella sp.]